MVRQPGRIALLALLLSGLAAPCRALFDAGELDKLDAEVLMDSEYFLDLRSFSYPNDWLWEWERNPRGWRINSASLDANDLWIEQEVALGKSLNDWFSFSYALDHIGDRLLLAGSNLAKHHYRLGLGVLFEEFHHSRMGHPHKSISPHVNNGR